MASFKIIGGKSLKGDLKVSGSKNEALKLIPFAFCFKNKITIKNVPDILDIRSQIEIAKSLGAEISFKENVLEIDTSKVSNGEISNKARKLRASIVYIGPLLARFKKVRCPHPGGCVIGARSVDTHTDAFKQLGATISKLDDVIDIELDLIKNKKITLKEKSVSATENVLLFCSAVNEEIEVSNIAIEPEIIHLIKIMGEAGVDLRFVNERTVIIKGTENLSLETMSVIPDRIEAGTFLIALLATGSEGRVLNFPESGLSSLTDTLRKSGAKFKLQNDQAIVERNERFTPFEITTEPYPGFPTDLQSPMALIAAKAKGTSIIHEEMFENRLGYLNELKNMGLRVDIADNHTAKITGPAEFKPTEIHSLDLRAGITLLVAALMTEGETTIKEAENIDRGYENIEDKLKLIGANIVRIND